MQRQNDSDCVLGVAVLLAFAAYLLRDRKPMNKKHKKKDAQTVVKGTVLSIEIAKDSGGGRMVVTYEQTPGNHVTRSFVLEQESVNGALPQIGQAVLVGWARSDPENAYLMPG